jgi:hypothetical protein
MRCLLIEDGFLRQRDSAQCFAASGLWPDCVSPFLR